MIDPSIALQVRIPQPDNPIETYGRALSLKSLVQQSKMGDLRMQQAELEAADQQKARQAYMESGGDLDKFQKRAAELGVGPNTLTAIQKHVLDTKKTVAEIDDRNLPGRKYQNEQMLGLTTAALALPDDQYAQQWPALRAQALRINPELQLPDQPVPKANLEAFRLGFITQDQLFKQEAEKRAANTDQRAAAEEGRKAQLFPSQLAESQAKSAAEVRTNAAAQLGAAQSADAYRQVWENLPAGVARAFPAPEQWDAKTTPAAVRQAGMKPAEQATAVQAATNAAETRRHNAVSEAQRREELFLQRKKFDADEGAIERTAQSLASGDLTRLRDIASLRGDQRLKIYDRAKQINPKFDTSTVDRKIKNEDYYANGKGADSLRSFGTFLEHTGGAMDAVASIRLSNSPAINKPLNWWRANMSGSPELVRLEAAIEPAKKEYESFLLGGHALEQDDRKAADRILNPGKFSPAMLEEGLKTIAHVAKARFTEENYRYKRISGHDLENPFSPEAIEGARKVGMGLSGMAGAGQGGQGQGGITVTAPDGSVHAFGSQADADKFKKLAGIK
jgi:hypothetical protein